MDISDDFLSNTIKRLKDYQSLGDKTFEQLSDEEMHFQPNEESNSIAVIIQHMHGNMLSRWTNFLTEDGEKEWRKRDDEFEIHNYTKEQLLQLWNDGWKVVFDVMQSLTPDDLYKTITIRTRPLIAVDAILRQFAHYSYHVGQIVYLGRWMRQSEWKSLSIPKGKSKEFDQKMKS